MTVGAEMFFSSRGNFNRPAGATVSTTERLSSEGWQSCSSCHFEGLTDGVVWQFGAGPRKSVPLNATFNPRNRNEQRVLNYSAIFDEVEDFEANIRNVSGPGAARGAAAVQRAPPPATSTLDPNHGLLIGDNGDINLAPCVVNAFAKANADRPQHTVTLPGSNTAVPALTALREWVRFAVRTPRAPFTRRGVGNRALGEADQARAARCSLRPAAPPATWAASGRSAPRTSPRRPPATRSSPRRRPGDVRRTDRGPVPEPLPARHRLVQPRRAGWTTRSARTSGPPRRRPPRVNAAGVAGAAPDALGIDYNGDGRGVGYNVPSLLGIEPAAALLPQRRLRDARLRRRQREAPHRERQAARQARRARATARAWSRS